MPNDEITPIAGLVPSIGPPKLKRSFTWLQEPLGRALRAMAVFVFHAMTMCVAMLAVFGAEKLAHYLWPSQQPKLFEILPLSFLFDAAHLGVIGTFIYQGTYEANAQFRGKRI